MKENAKVDPLRTALHQISDFERYASRTLWLNQGNPREIIELDGESLPRGELWAGHHRAMHDCERRLWETADEVGTYLGEDPNSPLAIQHRLRIAVRLVSSAVGDFGLSLRGLLSAAEITLEMHRRAQKLEEIRTLLSSLLDSRPGESSYPLTGNQRRILRCLSNVKGKIVLTADTIAKVEFQAATAAGNLKHALAELRKGDYLKLGPGGEGYGLTLKGRRAAQAGTAS